LTVKEKREFLGEYQRIQNRIVGLTFEIEKWKSIGDKVNSAMDASGVHGGGNSSKVERSAVNTSDILADIQKDVNKAKKQRADIITIINEKSRKMRHRELLTMHFINGMSARQIAKQYKKEYKTVENAITVALKEMDM
jgi:hypothetical protein